jgi:hypothetical protein
VDTNDNSDAAPGDEPAGATRTSGSTLAVKIAAGIAAVLLGAGVTYALEHRSGSTPSADAAAAGSPTGAGASGGGPGGPVAGEQHIQGTVAARTAGSVTVRSSAGTATYTVNATSEIVRDGQPATMADVQVGDPVLVHVFPSASGRMMVERLLAGSSATDPGPGPGPPPGGAGGAGGATA